MNKTISPSSLSGKVQIIPSKSASHRAVMMAALCKASIARQITGFLRISRQTLLVWLDPMRVLKPAARTME